MRIFELGNERVKVVPGASPETEFWTPITYMCSSDTRNLPALPSKSLKIPYNWSRPWLLKPRITGSSKVETTRGEQLLPGPGAHLHPWAGAPLSVWILFHFSSSSFKYRRWRHGMYQYVPVWVTGGAGQGCKIQPLCSDPRQPLGHLWSLSR